EDGIRDLIVTGVQTCALPISDAGQDAEDSVFVEADRMIAGGERNDLIEVLALNPKLVFARRVASVRTAFEHGDDYYFDGDRLTEIGRASCRERVEIVVGGTSV